MQLTSKKYIHIENIKHSEFHTKVYKLSLVEKCTISAKPIGKFIAMAMLPRPPSS